MRAIFPIVILFIIGIVNSAISVTPPLVLTQAIWLRSNESDQFPASPSEKDEVSGTTTQAEEIVPPTEEPVKVNLKSQDLSKDYIPEYCQCVAKYYCAAIQAQQGQRIRPKRAVNTASCREGQVMCCFPAGPGCGVVDQFPNFYPNPSYGEASFAEYPWTALILDSSNEYIYGTGIIISRGVILTSARNIQPYLGKRFKVRLGDWDLASDVEPFPAEEFAVNEIRLHPSYNDRTLQNDIAILRINSTIDLDSYPHIRSACLARPSENYKFSGARCVTAGWGFKPANRIVTGKNLLKEVDLQILEAPICQQAIRRAIQNPEYYWDTDSFICAGGQSGKGLCKGDEGTALVCQDTPTSRLVVVGLSSWGTSCGEAGFPGVFTNMANYYDWIKSVEPSIGQ